MPALTRADYRRLIAPDLWAFIERTETFYPAGTHRLPIEKQRRVYDRMADAFRAPRPASVTASDHRIGPARLRHYRSGGETGAAAVLFAHGGSLMLGGLESHDDVCAEICERTGFDVVSVDYRLAPEHGVDAARADLAAGLAWVRSSLAVPVLGVGDSAGGYLVAHLSWENRGRSDYCGQVLIYPGLGFESLGGSLDRHAHAPMLTRAEVIGDLGATAGADLPREMRVRALLPDPVGMAAVPPTVAISAEFDPLADSARHYVEFIEKAGGKALWLQDDGLVHGHLRARHIARCAAKSFDRVIRLIGLLGVRRWPDPGDIA